ncbi:MAG: hypothetical protein ABIO79_04860 [Ferruginibacter sp.]
MRIILSLLIFLSACNSGPKKDTVSFKDLEPLQGNWSGVQDVLAADDTTWTNYKTTLVITALKDSLQLDFSLSQSAEEEIKEIGILYIHEDGKKMNFGPSEYTIDSVKRGKDYLVITAIKEDVDNDKQADIRLTIGIRPGSISRYSRIVTIRREVKYKGTEMFFTRIVLGVGKEK